MGSAHPYLPHHPTQIRLTCGPHIWRRIGKTYGNLKKNSYEHFILMGKNYGKLFSWRILETFACVSILQREVCVYVCIVLSRRLVNMV